MTNEVDRAFGDFLDRREYDGAEEALFQMVRTSFRAGWLAAGGSHLMPQAALRLLPPHCSVLDDGGDDAE